MDIHRRYLEEIGHMGDKIRTGFFNYEISQR